MVWDDCAGDASAAHEAVTDTKVQNKASTNDFIVNSLLKARFKITAGAKLGPSRYARETELESCPAFGTLFHQTADPTSDRYSPPLVVLSASAAVAAPSPPGPARKGRKAPGRWG